MNYYNPLVAALAPGPEGQALAHAVGGPPRPVQRSARGHLRGTSACPSGDVARAFHAGDFRLIPGIGLPVNVVVVCQWTWMCAPPPVGTERSRQPGRLFRDRPGAGRGAALTEGSVVEQAVATADRERALAVHGRRIQCFEGGDRPAAPLPPRRRHLRLDARPRPPGAPPPGAACPCTRASAPPRGSTRSRRWRTWSSTPSTSSTRSGSTGRTWSACRWGAGSAPSWPCAIPLA